MIEGSVARDVEAVERPRLDRRSGPERFVEIPGVIGLEPLEEVQTDRQRQTGERPENQSTADPVGQLTPEEDRQSQPARRSRQTARDASHG